MHTKSLLFITTVAIAAGCNGSVGSQDPQGHAGAPGAGGGSSTGGASGSAGGAIGQGGALGSGGLSGGGGIRGAGGTPAAGGTSGSGGSPGTGGAPGVGGGGGAAAAGCTPANGIPFRYACWKMPNPASTNLPNPTSYTDLGDGTVRDNITGLVWQKAVTTTQAFTWTAAIDYCAGLTLAGRTWRLPTRIELLSLVDFTRTSPAINTTAFPSVPGGKYHWTASPWVVSQIATKPQDSWIVNFFEGLTSNAGDRTQSEYARCVSSTQNGPLPKLYTAVATGEVQDIETGLIWQQVGSAATMSFDDAQTYCAMSTLNGHSWRVPSIKELSTLVDENPPITKVSPAIDTVTFADTAATTPYWSSSLFAGMPAATHLPWAINFEDGFTIYSATAALVRCVR